MAFEIERRFTVKGEQWREFIISSQEFKQGYLITNENEWTVRVRIIDDHKCLLTLKKPKTNITRYEYEFRIPIKEGQSLWELCDTKLSKTRYELNVKNNLWVIDCFKEENFPLVLSEIELQTAYQKVDIPIWCNSEVTHLAEFTNAALAKSPFSKWGTEKGT